MNFVPYHNATPSWAWPIAIAAVVLVLLGMVIYSRGSKSSKRVSNTGGTLIVLGAVGMMAIVVIGAAQLGANDAHRTAAVSSQIQKNYGLKFSDVELSKLDYPFSKPDSNFEVFGSIEKKIQTEGTSFSERKIYLVWADGELGLSQSANGEDFESLPRKGADR